MVEDIKVILEANENLTKEVKEDLLELITLFNKNFKDVSLETLKERLKTLSIQRASMYLVKVPCKYIPHNNEIAINLGLMDGADGKHWLMHSLLGLITAQGNHYGFNDDNDSLVALNEGYTEIITNNLVGDVDNNLYTDEIIMTNLISKVIGADILYDAYFKNDSSSVVKAMTEAEAK